MANNYASSVRFAAWTSAVLALVLVVELVAIPWYAYQRLQTALEPENLVDRAEEAVRQNYPEFRETLTTTVKRQAPRVADEISQQVLAAAPETGEWLEDVAARQIEQGLDEVTELSAEQFQAFLDENHEAIEHAFEQLEDAPEEAHEEILALERSLEQQLGTDLQVQARQALELHRALNQKLVRLTDENETLESQELLEKRILRIVKTMQEERLRQESVAAAAPLVDVARVKQLD